MLNFGESLFYNLIVLKFTETYFEFGQWWRGGLGGPPWRFESKTSNKDYGDVVEV